MGKQEKVYQRHNAQQHWMGKRKEFVRNMRYYSCEMRAGPIGRTFLSRMREFVLESK